MANLDLITFEDIYTAALVRVKGDPNDEESFNKIKEIINTRQRQMCARKKWKFLRVTNRSLKLPKKITAGTVTFQSGSRTVTGVGTNFLSIHRNWWIRPAGINTSYRVIAVTSPTQLIISSPHTDNTLTNVGYKLYQGEIALFPDLEDIDDIRIDGWYGQIRPKGPSVINNFRQRFPDFEGRPRIYSIEGKAIFPGTILQDFVLGYDFLGSGETKAMSFFPHIPDNDYTLQMAYKKKISTMTLPTEEPVIPPEYRHVLLHYSLSDWYASNDSNMAAYYQKLGDTDFKDMISKYLDTDDILRAYPTPTNKFSREYLVTRSSIFFDTEY